VNTHELTTKRWSAYKKKRPSSLAQPFLNFFCGWKMVIFHLLLLKFINGLDTAWNPDEKRGRAARNDPWLGEGKVYLDLESRFIKYFY